MSDDLLPCPFCGGKPKWVSGGPGCAYISCTECPAETGDGSVPRIKASWNRRADLIENLEAKLAKAVGVAERSIKWLRLYGADVHREAATLAELKGGPDA